jgi:ribosome maturation factor RimP
VELEESIKLAVEGCGVNLYDIATTKEHKDSIFRVYISSCNGISLEQCTEVSRMISPILDIYPPMNGKYKLEVSSPGIERKIKTLEHFKLSIGEDVKIKEYSTETLKGKITEVNNNGTIILEDKDGDIQTINFDDILSASTYFEWKK